MTPNPEHGTRVKREPRYVSVTLSDGRKFLVYADDDTTAGLLRRLNMAQPKTPRPAPRQLTKFQKWARTWLPISGAVLLFLIAAAIMAPD